MVQEVLSFDLGSGIGTVEISYDVVSAIGTVEVVASYNGVSVSSGVVSSGATGSISVSKNQLFVDELSVIINSQTESSVSIVVGEISKTPMDVRTIVLTSECDTGKTAHYGYRYKFGEYVSAFEPKLVNFSKGTEVLHASRRDNLSGFEGDPMFPITDSEVTMYFEQFNSDTYEFPASSLYAFHALRTDLDLDNDIETIILTAQNIVPIQDADNPKSFYGKFDMSPSGAILYLVFDFRTKILIGGKRTDNIPQSCCEQFGFANYGIDGPTLDKAAHVFNSVMFAESVLDGYVSTGYNDPNSVVVKVENSRIVNIQPCPECVTDCEDISIAIEASSTGVYNIDVLLAGSIGAMVLKLDFSEVPNGIIVDYDGVKYNSMISGDGQHLASEVPNKPVFVGDGSDPCMTYLLTYPTMTLPVYEYYNGSFTQSGTETFSVGAGQINTIIASPDVYLATMVIPKTKSGPDIARIKIYSPCEINDFYLDIDCPVLLPIGSVGKTSTSCGAAAINKSAYTLKKISNTSIYPEIGDIMFADPYGATNLASVHGLGWYRMAEKVIADKDRSFEIDENGYVINIATCLNSSSVLKGFLCSFSLSDMVHNVCTYDLYNVAYSTVNIPVVGNTIYADANGDNTFADVYGSGYFRTSSGYMHVGVASNITEIGSSCPSILNPFLSSFHQSLMLEACNAPYTTTFYAENGTAEVGVEIFMDAYGTQKLSDAAYFGYYKHPNGGYFQIDSNSIVTSTGVCVTHKAFSAIKLAIGQDCWGAMENITLYFDPSISGSIPGVGNTVYTDILGLAKAASGSYKTGQKVLSINNLGVVTSVSDCVPPSILTEVQVSSTTGTMFSVCGLLAWQSAWAINALFQIGSTLFSDEYGTTRLATSTGAGYYRISGGWIKINELSVITEKGTSCPSPLTAFQSSLKKNSTLFACDATLSEIYYSDNGTVAVGKTIYVDAYLTTTLAIANGYTGYYKSPLGGWFQINSSSVITAVGNCLIPQ